MKDCEEMDTVGTIMTTVLQSMGDVRAGQQHVPCANDDQRVSHILAIRLHLLAFFSYYIQPCSYPIYSHQHDKLSSHLDQSA